MGQWNSRVKIKHLMTEDEGHAEVQRDMNAIADALATAAPFHSFDRGILAKMRDIPAGDEFFAPVDYANRLLDYVYDYADRRRIWIE